MYLALLVAGLVGITLSVPLQAPAVILFGIAALGAAIVLLARRGSCHTNTRWLLTLVTVTIGYFIIRSGLSPVFNLGVQDLMLILPASIFYLIAGYCFSGQLGARVRLGLAWLVIFLLLLHLGSALIQLKGSEGYSLSMYFTSAKAASSERITGMYGYYGSFANFMVITGLLCLSLGGWGKFSTVIRVTFFVLGGVALAAAVYSQSRSATLSLIVSLLCFAVLFVISLSHQKPKIKRRGNIVISIIGAVGVLCCFVGSIWVFNNRIQDDTGNASEMMFDSGVRMAFWSMAAEQWADYPIVGAGSRSYSYLANRYWSPNLPTGEASPEFVHNEYLQLLTDYGAVGLLVILCLLCWHFMLGFKRVRKLSKQVGESAILKGSNTMALTIAGMSGMVAMAVHITFDFRTHLLANLLLFVCCAVWVLPVSKAVESTGVIVRKTKVGSWALSLILLLIGMGALGLGGWQLWAGMPLLKSKIAKEDGAWIPQIVNRQTWIPALEMSVSRAPDFNRYQRLAILYQLEANDLSDKEKEAMMARAESAYLASIEHNTYNPVPWINLAEIYGAQERYDEAEDAFSRASEMAKSRERWFRMHSRWASLQQKWASEELRVGNVHEAEKHFSRAKELYLKSCDYGSFHQNKNWVVDYTRLLVAYARFFDSQQRYADAELLFIEGRKQVNWVNWQRESKMNFYYSQHLYEMGRYIWYQRKPQQAYQLMIRAKQQLIQHQEMMNKDVENGFDLKLIEIEQVISFLEQAGVK